MAIANKTRWSEKWHGLNGGHQVAKFRVTEDKDYNEVVIVTLMPIEDIHTVSTLRNYEKNSTGGVGLLVEDVKGGVGHLAQKLRTGLTI